MRFIMFALLVIGSLNIVTAQQFEGSWRLMSVNGENASDREVIKIVVDGYFALGSKSLNDNSFLGAAGGEFKIDGSKLIEKRDFDTYDDSKINTEKEYNFTWIDDMSLEISNEDDTKVWQKLSNANDDLNGNWVITGRERNGEMNTMTPGDRRTVKIINGERFQWVAFNSATKSFNGTGGGTYKTEGGKYIEHITFFSRDNDRVGDLLNFEYEVINGEWHHKGKSSKGQPIYEIWSPYAEAYTTEFAGD